MAVKIKHGRALSALSLTPLIDVVFLLLIFFLVASRFAKEDRELDVILPSASAAVPLTAQPTELFVNVDHDGRFFVDGKFIDADEVRELLEQAVANNPVNQSVIIRADERVPFRSVVVVMDLCNQTGVYDYSVTTAGQE